MKIKIMIVDDSELIINIIGKIINKFNSGIDIEFIKAHNGIESINKYLEEKPDLVFMDIMMPEMNGITALKNIKKHDKNAKIVIVTSLIQEEYIKYAVELEAVEFISKPFTEKEIKEALDKFLKIEWVET
jgi:two-component system, chemotaxis family, chemotaxis protein CheY